MVEEAVQSAGSVSESHPLRGWRSVFFAPVGDGQRRRRGSDGARLVLAVLALVVCLLVIHFDSRIDQAIVQVIHPPPWSITWLVTVVYQVGSFGVAILLVVIALLARRWDIARDIGLSAVATVAISGILVALLGGNGGRPGRHRDPRLLSAVPRAADRPVHGRGHGRAALSGSRRAAPHRDLHRPGVPGLGGRRSRAAGQRSREPGRRLGGDHDRPAHLRLTAGPALGR